MKDYSRYKTAYSKLFKTFVAILEVWKNRKGEQMITASVGGKRMQFRPDELIRYTL